MVDPNTSPQKTGQTNRAHCWVLPRRAPSGRPPAHRTAPLRSTSPWRAVPDSDIYAAIASHLRARAWVPSSTVDRTFAGAALATRPSAVVVFGSQRDSGIGSPHGVWVPCRVPLVRTGLEREEPPGWWPGGSLTGRAGGIRTHDLFVPNVYQGRPATRGLAMNQPLTWAFAQTGFATSGQVYALPCCTPVVSEAR